MDYNVHVNGTARNHETGFSCGFDLSVTNGGSVENVGAALQLAINKLSSEAVDIPVSTDDPEPSKE